MSVPIAQDDASSGFLYGLSARMLLGGRVALSASVEVVRHRDGHVEVAGEEIDLTPPDLRGYSANVDVFLHRSPSLTLYGTAGLGAARLGHVRGDPETNLAGSLGGGALLSLGREPIWLEVSPRLQLVESEGAARKQLGLRVGISYAIE